ncbi:immunoglobulin superfamily member 10-like isoform X1 [Eriocheir sinensis]|uniref:immunoglobulin superfamily member 10-like isoform X1 n=1 Tax=Eriocheir sinensis TaxID=95602 RepID=UPI0021C8647E|nr:immunoglobulin superfamily member 10-like isoform X1 [Eriocheir sinensis]
MTTTTMAVTPLLQGATTLLGLMLLAAAGFPAGVQAGSWPAPQTPPPELRPPPAPPSRGIHAALPPAATPPAAPLEPPSFDTRASGNVTALLGGTATLRCRVTNLGNKTVSWIRHRDLHLLSVGRSTYTSDQRFVARHTAAQEWLLIIHHLQERDAGLYECQISSTPPRSHLIYLAVVEPETAIVGGPDVYLNTGSQLALTCTVRFSPEPPAFILWYHGDKLVSYERTRGGGRGGGGTSSTSSSSSSSSGSRSNRSRTNSNNSNSSSSSSKSSNTTSSTNSSSSSSSSGVTFSRLLVQSARLSHSGVYTCDPANARPRSVNVHVLAGDQPEAIVHDNGGRSLPPPPHLLLFLLFLLPSLSSKLLLLLFQAH